MGPVALREVNQRRLLVAHHAVDVEHALDAGAAGLRGVVRHIQRAADDERRLGVLPRAVCVPHLLHVQRPGVQFSQRDVPLVLPCGVNDPQAFLVHGQVHHGLGVQAVHRDVVLRREDGAVGHRAVLHVVFEHPNLLPLIHVIEVVAVDDVARPPPGRRQLHARGQRRPRRTGEVLRGGELVDGVFVRPV